MKKIIVFTLIAFSAIAVNGQKSGSQIVYANWNFGPLVNNHFVKDFSASGASVGYTTFIKNNLGIGGEIAWGNFYEYSPRYTYQSKDGAITTDMYKYIFTVPVTATVTKYFTTGRIVYPFAKLGIGAQYSEQSMFYNVYEDRHSDWGFVTAPELGANIRISRVRPLFLNVGAQYKYATNRSIAVDMKHLASFNFNLGATWQIR